MFAAVSTNRHERRAHKALYERQLSSTVELRHDRAGSRLKNETRHLSRFCQEAKNFEEVCALSVVTLYALAGRPEKLSIPYAVFGEAFHRSFVSETVSILTDFH